MHTFTRSTRTRFAVAGLAVAGLVSTAAFSSGAAATEPRESVEVASAGTDPDATLHIAYAGPLNSIDPHKSTNSTFPMWVYPVYDRLFEIDGDDNVNPMLATGAEFSEDGTTATLALRDDVVFHDGTPFTADAVKASIERGQTVEGSTVATLLAGITSVEVVDDHTVTLTLDGIGAEVTALLATNAGAVINPAVIDDASADLDTAPPAGAGTGPYVAVESAPNVETVYERAPEYWDDSSGYLAGFTVTFVGSATSRLSGLRAGDFDLIQVTPDVIEEAQGYADAGEFTMVRVPAATQEIMFNIDTGDLADAEVRRAISLAIDTEEISIVYTCLPNTQPQREGHWAFNPDIATPSDPEAAAEIISARGGASFELTYAAGGATEALATVIQAQMANVGIDMSLRGVEQVQLLASLGTGESQAVLSTMTSGPDPVEVLNRYFFGGGNIARGPIGDELREIAGPGVNPNLSQDERAAIYQEVFQGIADNYLYVPVCQSEQGWASTVDLVGVEHMPGINRGIPDLTAIGVAAS